MLTLLSCATSPPPVVEDAGLAPPTGDPATVTLAGSCPLASRLGGFTVEANEDYSAVDGMVLDGVVPVTVLTEVGAAGECRLLRRENPYCDPTCASDETCDLTETCVPYPTAQDLGAVEVAGLEADVVMEPAAPGYTYFDTEVPHPVYLPDVLVELRTGGGVYEAVTLHGVGVEPLVLVDKLWTVTRGSAFSLSWQAPVGLARSHVAFTLSVDQHGLTPGSIVCEFADDGSGEVPAELVDAMLAAGVTGYPKGRVVRQTADRDTVGPGCMDFKVTSPVSPDSVDVTGHTPCDEDYDCPPGHHCNLEIETCE